MKANGSMKINYQGKEFDLTPPWRRLKMSDAVKEITGVDFDKINTDEEAREAAIKYGMDPDDVNKWTRGKILAEMFEDYCEDVPGTSTDRYLLSDILLRFLRLLRETLKIRELREDLRLI